MSGTRPTASGQGAPERVIAPARTGAGGLGFGLMLCMVSARLGATAWSPVADLPTPREFAVSLEAGGYMYVIGGHIGGGPSAVVERYDPATNTWTTLPGMPTARMQAAGAVVGGKLYVIGGATTTALCNVSAVEVFDPVTNAWSTLSPMASANGNMAAAVVGNAIYLVGGGSIETQNTVLRYVPSTGVWTTRASLPAGRATLSAAVVGGKVYAFGGEDLNNATSMKATVQVYDPAANTWSMGPNMTSARGYAGSVVINNHIVVLGGYRDDDSVEVFDPATNAWTGREAMPLGRGGLAAATLNGNIYVTGGADGTSNLAQSYVGSYKAALVSSLCMVPTPVQTGSVIQMRLTVTNTGSEAASGVSAQLRALPASAPVTLVGAVSPASPATIVPGGSLTFTWSVALNGAGTALFSVTASGTDSLSGAAIRTVAGGGFSVLPRAALACSLSAVPDQGGIGKSLELRLTVTNVGGATANAVSGVLAPAAGAGLVAPGTGPVPSGPVSLAPGASQTFTWTWLGTGLGTVVFSATATGTDPWSSDAVHAGTTAAVPITAGHLAAALAVVPASAVAGQIIEVHLTVTNTGGGDVADLIPTLDLTSGASLVTPPGGALPPGPLPLSAFQSQTFVWTCEARHIGTVGFLGKGAGSDPASGISLLASGSGIASIAAGPPAVITLSPSKPRPAFGESIVMTAQVIDGYGNHVAGSVVWFTVISGPGSLSVQSTLTDGAGRATAGLIAGIRPDRTTIKASVGLMSVTASVDAVDTANLDGPGGAIDRNVFSPSRGEPLTIRVFPLNAAVVTIRITTTTGRLVRMLSVGELAPGGRTSITWDGRNAAGDLVQRGVYLVRMTGGAINCTLKVVAR